MACARLARPNSAHCDTELMLYLYVNNQGFSIAHVPISATFIGAEEYEVIPLSTSSRFQQKKAVREIETLTTATYSYISDPRHIMSLENANKINDLTSADMLHICASLSMFRLCGTRWLSPRVQVSHARRVDVYHQTPIRDPQLRSHDGRRFLLFCKFRSFRIFLKNCAFMI
jgi:hypothetical protein